MSGDAAEQTDTQAAIMEATYRALCDHGYADLTIQAIADEFAKSKSLLYYHYDTKDEILVAFLSYMLDQFTVEDAIDTTDSPDDQLWSLIDNSLPPSPDPEQREFQVALFELRSQALSDEAYREQFTRADRFIKDTLADVLVAGIDDGTFRDVDVERTVELLATMLDGAMLRRTTITGDSTPATREALAQFIERQILAEE
jgi:AcrR family transcriptional regulator